MLWGIVSWLVIGALAGWVASLITGTNDRQGCLLDIVVGVVGAFIGGLIWQLLTGEPVAIGRRFYFVLVEQRENARQVPFADAQDEIRPILERERYIQLVNDHVTDLWRKAAVGPVEPFMRTVLSRMPTYEALRTNPLLSAAATPDGPATNGVEPLP